MRERLVTLVLEAAAATGFTPFMLTEKNGMLEAMLAQLKRGDVIEVEMDVVTRNIRLVRGNGSRKCVGGWQHVL